MPVLLTDEELATSRSTDERDPSSQIANNALITEAVSDNVNGLKGFDLNEIDYDDGTFNGESGYWAGKTSHTKRHGSMAPIVGRPAVAWRPMMD